MHLPAKADSGNLALIGFRNQFLNACHGLLIPVLRLLFRPARMREIQRIFFGYNFVNLTFSIHQKKLHGTGS